MKKINEKNIKVDRLYNIVRQNETGYEDRSSGLIEMIDSGKAKGIISHIEASFLLRLVLSKEIKEESQELHKWGQALNERQEESSLFMNFVSRERNYA